MIDSGAAGLARVGEGPLTAPYPTSRLPLGTVIGSSLGSGGNV